MYFNLFDFLLGENSRYELWFHLIQCLPCALARTGFSQDSILMGLGARAPAVCAFAGEAGWEIVYPPFPFTLKASALRGVCSQYIPLYHSLAFLWPYSLWMKKEKVQVFSLSEPVHWIIHTKRFLLKEEQGGEGVFHRLVILQTPVPRAWGWLWEGNPLEWVGYGGSKLCLEFICISQKLTLYLCSL